MNAVAQFARPWLDWTVSSSWQLALLIGLIAAIAYALRDASPRLRYGLWLLVLLKALLPPTLGAFWAVGAWGVAPVVNFSWPNESTSTNALPLVREWRESFENNATATEVLTTSNTPNGEGPSAVFLTESPLLLIWAAGCLSLLLAVTWRYWRITRMTDSMRRIEEGPASVELHRLADLLSVRRTPNLYTTEQAISPMLFGVLTPKIVLPQPILDRLNPQELRMVLAHELMHWRRRDTWVGWLQVVVQCAYWFHPLVWLANTQIRHERECACDETVLREMSCDPEGYGEAIVQVLTAARGRSLVVANMVGIFERGSLLQDSIGGNHAFRSH